jgi:uncharacterized membrane protein
MMWAFEPASWFWFAPMMLVMWGLAIAATIVLVKFFSTPRYDSYAALEALRRRFESGQITRDEYDQAKAILGW